jgi:hypothetical protein
MQAPFDNIVQHLFHQPSLYSVTVDELENMAIQHPYFAAAHFLLLKKMQDTAHPAFTDQLHKTTIYFNNPLWLQFLLQPESVSNFTVSEKPPFISSEPMEPLTFAAEENSNGHMPVATVMENDETVMHAPVAEPPYEHTDGNTDQSSLHHSNEDPAAAENSGMMNIINEIFSDPNPLYNTIPVEETSTIVTEEIPAPPVEAATEPGEITQPADESPSFADTEMSAAAPVPEEPLIAIAAEESTESALENVHVNEPPAETIAVQQPDENITAETTTEINSSDNHAAAIIHEHTGDNNLDSAAEADATEKVDEMGSDHNHTDETQTVREEAPLIKKIIIETPAAQSDLLFEPYHTVDYFASQGIKLSKMEVDSKDKLGRQLKSFTEWLKTMKKLPQVSINKILAENEESKVVEDANHSIEPKEVNTEAMAEVFEKQGLHEKAAEIYQKLSLLNPSKSAYFAARIEALKL